MELIVQQGDLAQTPCDVLIVNLFEGVTAPGGATGAVDQALGGWISLRIAQDKFQGKARTILEIPTFGKIPAGSCWWWAWETRSSSRWKAYARRRALPSNTPKA